MTIDKDDIPNPPEGVTLRDPEDADGLRDDIHASVTKAMDRYVNNYAYNGVRLQLKNMKIVDKERFTTREQHDAKLKDRLLHRRLRGDVELVDEVTNEVLDTKKGMTLARIPYLTNRGTFINNGSEFGPKMQARLLPGSYTRRRDNGELETHFNVRPGTGSAMRVVFDPSSAQYRLRVGSSDLHAYSVFKDLGVTDEELERRWGPDILAANQKKYSRHTLDRLYNKAIPKWERDPNMEVGDKVKAIREAFGRAQIADSIMRRNLPNLYDREKAAHWRMTGRAVQKMRTMVKEASERFEPDMTPNQVIDDWLSFDFGMEKAAADFDPDIAPEDMRETYNSVQGNTGPQLASMRRWPDHWLDDQDSQGWLEWYKNYHDGRRTDTDDRQKKRWKSFKARHGAQFVARPTPRRAFALKNWGIDPLKMLGAEAATDMEEKMNDYRGQEYMKWYMNRHDFDDDRASRLGGIAKKRGATFAGEIPDTAELMTATLDGHIKPEDLQ